MKRNPLSDTRFTTTTTKYSPAGIICLLLLLSSCKSGFLQRRYMPGAFAEKINSFETIKRSNKNNEVNTLKSDRTHSGVKKSSPCKQTLAEAIMDDSLPVKKQRNNCGDTIHLKDGKKIPCRVTLITDKEIQYMHCSDPRLFLKSHIGTIHHIQYYNGVYESFKSKTPETVTIKEKPANPGVSTKQPTGFSLFGFICSMIAGLLLIFVAPPVGFLIAAFSLTGLIIITANQQKINSSVFKFFRVLGMVFGIFSLALLTLMLVGLVILIAG